MQNVGRPALLQTMPTALLGLDREAFNACIASAFERENKPLRPYLATQVWQGIHQQGRTDFGKITNISSSAVSVLQKTLQCGYPAVKEHLLSQDGTTKWLLDYGDSREIETVFIPQVNRSEVKQNGAICVSSQVGCSLACSFCHTGTQKFNGNLTSAQIVGQVMTVMNAVGDFPLSMARSRKITNIVYMVALNLKQGQGEPLYNFKNVSAAVLFVNDVFGYAPHRTTISTSGLVPLMGKISKDLKACLAVSLHATTDDLRDELVPINKQYPISELMKGCQSYLDGLDSPGNQNYRITFEYVMLNGVNDSIEDAKRLVKLIRGFPSHVNLIPFNSWPGASYQCSSNTKIDLFRKIIIAGGIPCHTRTPRGQDISAACGQLKSIQDSKKIAKKLQ